MKGEPRQDRIKNAGRVLRRFIGTICEPTPISKYCKYLFLWKEAVFRHSLPFYSRDLIGYLISHSLGHALRQFVHQPVVEPLGHDGEV